MHFKLKLIQIGNSVGVTLPKEMLAAMKIDKGDTITVTPAPDGFRLSPYDADVDKQVETRARLHAGVPRHPACAGEMSEPIWVRRDVLELLHSESIAEHGGLDGLKDEGLFESRWRGTESTGL
ncbi:MAG: AbrB/MazE/SpoVT family DNA-binding domain-containing protein [Rhizomicrobium sp.]